VFWAWYAYLRWVDDLVDEELSDADDRQLFLERQLNLVRGTHIYSDTCKQEGLLRLLIVDPAGSENSLRASIEEMLHCIDFDARRGGKPAPYEAMRANRKREATAYLAAIAYFCGLDFSDDPPGREAAEGAKLAHVMRDFAEDIKRNELNISLEEIDAYGMGIGTTDSLPHLQLTHWMACNYRIARRRLLAGWQTVRSCGNTRYKLIVLVLIAKYQAYLRSLRARNFVPEADTRLRLRSFAIELGRLAFSSPAASPPYAIPSRLRPAVRLSVVHTVTVVAAASSWSNRATLADLRHTLSPVRHLIGDGSRKRRRFRGAYLLGSSACSAIAPVASRRHRHLAGLIVGYWGLSAIEMDRLQDESLISKAEILQIAEQWIHAIHCAVASEQPLPSFEKAPHKPDCIFAAMSNRLFALLREFCSECAQSNYVISAKKAFCDNATFLMRGQMTSFLQADLADPKNWSWYYREIMNHKNVEFLLTPFRLYAVEEVSAARFQALASAFLALNGLYLHYQLLDDLADAMDDMKCGIVGAPGFVLLSQGALASAFIASSTSDSPESIRLALQSIESAIDRSDLLCAELVKSPIFDSLRHWLAAQASSNSNECIEARLRCAIANVEAELYETLPSLADRRNRESWEYLNSLRIGNVDRARDLLIKSNVPIRLLSAVGEEAAAARFAKELVGDKPLGELRILFAMERMMRRTYRAACRFAQTASATTDGASLPQ
jgi:hypothetical protein